MLSTYHHDTLKANNTPSGQIHLYKPSEETWLNLELLKYYLTSLDHL